MPHGGTGWLITRYHDVRFVLGDRRFSNARAIRLPDQPRVYPSRQSRAHVLPGLDPPTHTRLRQLFNKAFGAEGAERWQPRVQQLADTFIDDLTAAGTSADLRSQLFDPLALQLIGEVMGVPANDRDHLFELASTIHSRALPAEEYQRQINIAGEYFDTLVEHRRRHPGDDAISKALAVRNERADQTADTDIASMALGLFGSGGGNPSSQLQTGIHVLLSHPDQFATLRENPHLISNCVDELMRYAPLIIGPFRARYIQQDVEVGGVKLPAGDFAIPSGPAANFDPHVFDHPFQLNLTRERIPTLTFGFGVHYCQAAQYSRMTIATVLATIVKRLPTLQLATPSQNLRWTPDRRQRSLAELPVSWQPAKTSTSFTPV